MYPSNESILSLADGGLAVVASDVVPPDSVSVDVVEDGQALAAGLGLRAAGQGARGVGPVAGAGEDAVGAAVLPAQGLGVAGDAAAGPEVLLPLGAGQAQEVPALAGVVEGDHPHAPGGALGLGGGPGEGALAVAPGQVVVAAVPLVVAAAALKIDNKRVTFIFKIMLATVWYAQFICQ